MLKPGFLAMVLASLASISCSSVQTNTEMAGNAILAYPDLEETILPPRELMFSQFPGGAAINQSGRRHALARLDESYSESQKKLAWTKYCHNRIDMNDEDWRAIRDEFVPEEFKKGCDSRSLYK